MADPAIEEKNEISVTQKKIFHSIITFRVYCTAAKDVPVNAGIFKVPITVATAYCGNSTRAAGVWISPPPPTIESTKPAKKAKKHNKISSVVNGC
jgi:hypothetical protein